MTNTKNLRLNLKIYDPDTKNEQVSIKKAEINAKTRLTLKGILDKYFS